jgi:hypothetical protein
MKSPGKRRGFSLQPISLWKDEFAFNPFEMTISQGEEIVYA